MSFDTIESSVESGQPIEIYTVVLGSTTYRMTSAAVDVTYDGNTYTAVEMAREALSAAVGERSDVLNVTLPKSHALAAQFVGSPPPSKAELTIHRYHFGDTDAVVMFKGTLTVVGFSEDGVQAKLAFVAMSGQLGKLIPRYNYGPLCSNILYSTQCGIVAASHKYSGEVTDETGLHLTIDGLGSAHADAWAKAGYVKTSGGDYRMIRSHTGDSILLYISFPASVLGQTVDVYPGCARTGVECHDKFDNVINFNGYVFVPTRNIFKTGLA